MFFPCLLQTHNDSSWKCNVLFQYGIFCTLVWKVKLKKILSNKLGRFWDLFQPNSYNFFARIRHLDLKLIKKLWKLPSQTLLRVLFSFNLTMFSGEHTGYFFLQMSWSSTRLQRLPGGLNSKKLTLLMSIKDNNFTLLWISWSAFTGQWHTW